MYTDEKLKLLIWNRIKLLEIAKIECLRKLNYTNFKKNLLFSIFKNWNRKN